MGEYDTWLEPAINSSEAVSELFLSRPHYYGIVTIYNPGELPPSKLARATNREGRLELVSMDGREQIDLKPGDKILSYKKDPVTRAVEASHLTP